VRSNVSDVMEDVRASAVSPPPPAAATRLSRHVEAEEEVARLRAANAELSAAGLPRPNAYRIPGAPSTLTFSRYGAWVMPIVPLNCHTTRWLWLFALLTTPKQLVHRPWMVTPRQSSLCSKLPT